MRIAATIELSARERKRLQQNVQSRTTPMRLIERSKILLLADEGVTNQMIASRLGIPENKVGRWRNRYAEGGLKAIEKDRPRGGNHGGIGIGAVRLPDRPTGSSGAVTRSRLPHNVACRFPALRSSEVASQHSEGREPPIGDNQSWSL